MLRPMLNVTTWRAGHSEGEGSWGALEGRGSKSRGSEAGACGVWRWGDSAEMLCGRAWDEVVQARLGTSQTAVKARQRCHGSQGGPHSW